MAIPYFFYGLPLYILKYFSQLRATPDFSFSSQQHGSDATLITVQTNTLIYYPRLFMTLCSLIIDIVLFNLANLCDLDTSSVLLTFASSYIAIVYLTRTFSNSIETLLFALLIYLIIKSIKSQYVLNDKFLVESSSKVKNVVSSAGNEFKITKSSDNDYATTSSLSSSIKRIRLFDIYKFAYLGEWIGVILAIGVFNRPTFLIFAFVPLAFWTLYGLENCNTFYQVMHYAAKRLLAVSKWFMTFALAFIMFDTVYFYKLVIYYINLNS